MHLLNQCLTVVLYFFISCTTQQDNNCCLQNGNTIDKNATLPVNNIVYMSDDGGKSWKDVSAGLPEKTQPNALYADENQILLGYDKGLISSDLRDKNIQWKQEIFFKNRVTSITKGLNSPYVANYEDGFYQKIKQSDIWIPVFKTLETNTVHSIMETSDNGIFAGSDEGIFKSSDSGQSWKKVYDKGMILMFHQKDGVLYAGGADGLFTSSDGGEHWTGRLINDGMVKKIINIDGNVMVCTNGMTSQKDSVFIGPSNKVVSRLYISNDQGQTWNNYSMNLTSDQDITDIVEVENNICLSNKEGVFCSNDKGKTWKKVIAAADGKVYKLAVHGKMIIALSVNEGC
jgi:photosystem II stability/assembly factor-like uncharacterized protein